LKFENETKHNTRKLQNSYPNNEKLVMVYFEVYSHMFLSKNYSGFKLNRRSKNEATGIE